MVNDHWLFTPPVLLLDVLSCPVTVQVLLRYGLRSCLQACLSRSSHPHAPLPSEDGQRSSCELADLALAMLKVRAGFKSQACSPDEEH